MTSREGPGLVGLVIVSHSDLIARGVRDLVAQVAPDVHVEAAGGTAEGGLGTDVVRVMAAIREADGEAGVLVLTDLGSAVIGADTAIDLLGDAGSRAIVADAPLVEGSVAAAVRAQTGGSLIEVNAAAAQAGSARLRGHGDGGGEASREIYRRVVTLVNDEGLHARPAAELVKLATALGGAVTINGADARSLLGILSLGLLKGAALEITTDDPASRAVVDRLADLVESGFEHG